MYKESPVLRKSKDGGNWNSDPDRLWLCVDATDSYWEIRSDRIVICGQTTRPRWEHVEARPYVGSWAASFTKLRYSAYADWLESFNAPVVYVWIEEVV